MKQRENVYKACNPPKTTRDGLVVAAPFVGQKLRQVMIIAPGTKYANDHGQQQQHSLRVKIWCRSMPNKAMRF